MTPIDRRWERLGRLISEDGVRHLQNQHVVVCGMGGVGSWAAEALARSAIGRLTLIDFDDVSLTTINRQLPGLDATVGRPKVDVMRERLLSIDPATQVVAKRAKLEPHTFADIIGSDADFLIDAIDQLGNKCALLAWCTASGLPVVSSMGAGGRLDPTAIRTSDLALTDLDPLARMVRVYLRTRHDFPANGPFGIQAVWSHERCQRPLSPTHPDAERGRSELPKPKWGDPLTSGMRNVVMGTACFVTSVFGMTAASVVVNSLLARRTN